MCVCALVKPGSSPSDALRFFYSFLPLGLAVVFFSKLKVLWVQTLSLNL